MYAYKLFRNATAIPPTKPPPRKSYYADKDKELNTYKTLYTAQSITLEVYLNKIIIKLYKFNKKKAEREGNRYGGQCH